MRSNPKKSSSAIIVDIREEWKEVKVEISKYIREGILGRGKLLDEVKDIYNRCESERTLLEGKQETEKGIIEKIQEEIKRELGEYMMGYYKGTRESI